MHVLAGNRRAAPQIGRSAAARTLGTRRWRRELPPSAGGALPGLAAAVPFPRRLSSRAWAGARALSRSLSPGGVCLCVGLMACLFVKPRPPPWLRSYGRRRETGNEPGWLLSFLFIGPFYPLLLLTCCFAFSAPDCYRIAKALLCLHAQYYLSLVFFCFTSLWEV